MSPPEGPIVVTGAAGYLGGRLASALGDRARAVVRAPVGWLPSANQAVCDLLGPLDAVRRQFAGAAAVVHLAGHNEVVAGRDPERATAETEAMAAAVAAAAGAEGVDRIVYVSTVHVYGEHLVAGAVVDESVAPAPLSPYARARRACEVLFEAADHLDTVVLRLSNAVGAPADPHVDRWTLVASDLCRQAVLDRAMVLHSSGQQGRDFIPLEDVSRMVLATLDPTGVPQGTYNLAAGRSATVRALAELVQDRTERACGWRPTLTAPAPTGPAEPPYTIDAGRLAGLGLRAELTLEEGVDEIIDHCTKHEAVLRSIGGSPP